MDNLITESIPAQPEKKVNLILTNFANAYIKPLFFVPNPITPADENKFDDHTPFPTRDNLALVNGKPVLVKITLESEPYEVETFNERTKTFDKAKIEGAKLDLGTVLVDVQMSKNIVTTTIDGMNGTVKEYICDGDYEITLRGAIVNEKGNAFPLADFKKLNTIVKAPISIKVTGDFLSLFSIHNVVINDYSFPQKEGYTNTQLFEINCMSDNAIDVIKINKQ